MVSAKTAIMLVLRLGPAYGRELRSRILDATHGRVHLSAGTLHPALRALRAAGLLAAWRVVPGRTRGGRSRTYYELTLAGVCETEGLARALTGLVGTRESAAHPSPPAELIRARAERVAEVSRAITQLREAVQRGRRSA